MKIFIAGARSITGIAPAVSEKMKSIYDKGFDVLVGDCYGVDASVQGFYANLNYDRVTVYATGGKARNNIGNWHVKAIAADHKAKSFEFYRQKDIAMANDADYGVMVWDGKSKGTKNNIITMVEQGKPVLVYLAPDSKMIVVNDRQKLNQLLQQYPQNPHIQLRQCVLNID